MRVDSLEQSVIESVNYANLKGEPDRGAYVAIAGGCVVCHTDKENGGEILAGGAPLPTPFGTFHAPNITSHPQAGIGNWTLGEFVKAMVVGRSPDGAHYYPVFPYTSYTAMSPQDLVDLKSWLDTVEPVSSNAAPHEISWPFSLRVLLVGWKAMFFNTATELDPADRGKISGQWLITLRRVPCKPQPSRWHIGSFANGQYARAGWQPRSWYFCQRS